MIKRLFDIVLSAFGLLIVAPVFVIIALLIKLDSTGPVFFRQKRVGKDEVPFYIFKFFYFTYIKVSIDLFFY